MFQVVLKKKFNENSSLKSVVRIACSKCANSYSARGGGQTMTANIESKPISRFFVRGSFETATNDFVRMVVTLGLASINGNVPLLLLFLPFSLGHNAMLSKQHA